MKKISLFMVKHCKQGGALPDRESSLCQTHVLCVFEQHVEAVSQICLTKDNAALRHYSEENSSY